MNAEMLLHSIGAIDEKFIEEAAPGEKIKGFSKPNEKSNYIWRFTPVAASFVVLLVVFTIARNIWNGDTLPQPPMLTDSHMQTVMPSMTPTQKPEASPPPAAPQKILSALVAGQHEPKVMLADGELNFLAIDTESNSPAPPFIDPQTTYKERWDLSAVIDYLEVDFRPGYVPDDLFEREEEPFWSVIFNNDGTRIPYSFSFGLRYSENFDDEHNPLRRTLTVKAAKDDLPFGCSIYATEMNVSSNINGIPIAVGYCRMAYGPYTGEEKTPAGYYDAYIAEFMYEGVGYMITSANLTQEEFINVLLSLVK